MYLDTFVKKVSVSFWKSALFFPWTGWPWLWFFSMDWMTNFLREQLKTIFNKYRALVIFENCNENSDSPCQTKKCDESKWTEKSINHCSNPHKFFLEKNRQMTPSKQWYFFENCSWIVKPIFTLDFHVYWNWITLYIPPWTSHLLPW